MGLQHSEVELFKRDKRLFGTSSLILVEQDLILSTYSSERG